MSRCSARIVLVASGLAFACSGSSAAVSIYLGPEALAAAAPLVIEATVERTASGYDPVTGSLATYVTLRVGETHRGPSELDRVVLREPGGAYGGLVNEVDAVPIFSAGERVLVFAEPARDGALRTAGMFFGKFLLTEVDGALRARREMSGRGTILRAPPEVIEDFSRDRIAALVASTPVERSGLPAWRRVPPEFDRLVWSEEAARAEFVGMTPQFPARWEQADTDVPISVDLERAGNPLGDGAAAAAEISRGMSAWSGIPEARVVLRLGNDDAAFTAASALSPARSFPASSVILFGDPYDDLPDPLGCAGTIAFGGYWRGATAGRTVNHVAFYPIRRLYVIVNRRFECFLGDPKNLAEIATHELGHGLGFGHSSAPDSVLRSFAYGDRGAVLGADDRDAAHCVYPHTFTVILPNGEESWKGGAIRTIAWQSTSESGIDPGLVDLDYSTDGGHSWIPIASGAANDGSVPWVVPNTPTLRARVRVGRRTLAGPPPAPFPALCSQDASDRDFTILPGTGPVGTVPDGVTGPPLRVSRGVGGGISLSWGPSCGRAWDHAVYEGSLDALRAGTWDHQPVACSAGADLVASVPSSAGDRYYLVAPIAGRVEGSLGRGSSGALRPVSRSACGTRESATCP